MTLNHINLGVTDVPATVALFETYFGLRGPAHFPANDRMAFLNDEAGMLLSLFKVNDVGYPKIFHVGFMRPTTAEVDEIHGRLAAGGFAPGKPRVEHGRYTFYFQAPGGFTVEVNSFEPSAGR